MVGLVAAIAFVLSLAVALPTRPTAVEVDVTAWFNGAPDVVAVLLWPVMQLGTFVAPLVVAAAILALTRNWALAVATVAAGVGAWCAAVVAKHVVDRGRPPAFMPDIDIREGTGNGLGFISGHSAVAAATAVCVIAAVPGRWRAVPIALAVLVGIARIVYGVHFPADVVGGWAIGILVGLLALTVLDVTGAGRARRRRPATSAPT